MDIKERRRHREISRTRFVLNEDTPPFGIIQTDKWTPLDEIVWAYYLLKEDDKIDLLTRIRRSCL